MNLAYFLFLSITVMLTSFIIKSLVVLVKFKLLRDERLEYTSNKNIDDMALDNCVNKLVSNVIAAFGSI